MIARPYTASYSQLIESVTVHTAPAPIVLVVTQNPLLAGGIKRLLQEIDDDLSIIWLTSVASACRRLEWTGSAMVILDHHIEAQTTEAEMAKLQSAAPGAGMMIVTKDHAS